MRGPIVPFGAAALISMVVLFTPASQTPQGPWGADKVVHIALFALLARTGRWSPVRGWVLVLGLAGYAVLSEVVQAVAPLQRSGSASDVLADLIGIGVGLVGIHPALIRHPRAALRRLRHSARKSSDLWPSVRLQLTRTRRWHCPEGHPNLPGRDEPVAGNTPPRGTR